MNTRLTDIDRHEDDNLDDIRIEHVQLAQDGLDKARQVLAFMEKNIPVAMRTRDYSEWGS